ncbi:MAG: hemerythrin family protein [Gammaproteobacteria bacterium]|nr:MAG: hemerythrin family protein [Gammaproteobacteria bacterium]
MKNITWDESLTVDVQDIDEDHRKLVELYNLLSHSVDEGCSAEYIDAVLDEMISFTIWHFRHEERLMLLYKYQDIAAHKAEHCDLVDSARELQQKFHEKKMLTEEDIDYLESWLTVHILGHDMRLGFYLLEVM